MQYEFETQSQSDARDFDANYTLRVPRAETLAANVRRWRYSLVDERDGALLATMLLHDYPNECGPCRREPHFLGIALIGIAPLARFP
jgi:hypothetical protein